MTATLLILVLGSALLDWMATAKQWVRVEMFAKPAVMIFLFAWLYAGTRIQGALLWFGLGLLFSLIGDLLLLSPDRLFLPGLIAFLLAQVAYIIGFSSQAAPANAWDLVFGFTILLSAIRILQRLIPALRSRGLNRLVLPVGIYALIISTMLFFAVRTLAAPAWQTNATVLASVGALLFYISDLILAWNRFVSPIPNGRLLNICAYHLGQTALIIGVAMHFG
ncbi:MAG TPA: lysoplasmalogenase [Anaerolineales bacterium]|nr:lysoplasmalogenase [Anaerolineales bacterium]